MSIVIIAMMIGILLPALGGAKHSAMDTKCKVHLRQVSTAQFMHLQDSGVFARLWLGTDDDIETGTTPVSPLADYLQVDHRLLPEPGSVMQCPSVEPGEFERLTPLVKPGQQVSSFGINPAMQFDRWAFGPAISRASELILVGEQALEPFEQLPTAEGVTATPMTSGGAAWVGLNNHNPQRGYRHVRDGANFAMHDGSARRLFHNDLALRGAHWAWWDPWDDPWTVFAYTATGDSGGCGCGE